jgi:hypothetical protein
MKFFNMSSVPTESLATTKSDLPKQSDLISTSPMTIHSKASPIPAGEAMKKAVEPATVQQPSNDTLKPALPDYALELSLNKNRFKIGDQLTLKFTVKEALYVNIAVINSLGDVTMIYPNPYQKNNYSVPGVTYQIPPQGGKTTLDISGPTGTEHVVAIASDTALLVNETDYKDLGKLNQNNRVISKTLTYQIY